MRARNWLAVVAMCVLGGGFAPDAVASSGVVRPADVPGLHRIGASAGTARRDLEAPLSPGLRRAVARARIATSAFKGGGLVIDSASLSLGRASSRVVRAWHRGSRPVRVGDGGYVQVSKRSARLVFRVHGTVVLLEARGIARRSATALLLPLATDIASRLLMPPPTAFDLALGGRATDDTLPRAIALRAFAAVYRLPGVIAPRGASMTDGSAAIGLLLRYASSLTPTQRAAAEREIGVGLPGSSASAARALARTAAGTPAPDAYWTGVARLYEDDYVKRINAAGVAVTHELPITVTLYDKLRADVVLDATAVDANGNESTAPTSCSVRVTRPILDQYSYVEARQVVAEAAFKCLVYQLNPTHWQDLPDFTFNGLSAYAAETLVPGADRLRDAFRYFTNPGKTAEARSEDAAFIFGRVEEDFNAELWGQVPALVTDYRFGTIFSQLNLASNKFLDSWGSSLFRDEGIGPAWTTHRPEYYSYDEVAVPITEVFDSGEISAQSSTNALYEHLVIPGATDPIVMVRLKSGHARVGDNKGTVDVAMDTPDQVVWVCANGVDCHRCPDGSRAVGLPAGILFAQASGSTSPSPAEWA